MFNVCSIERTAEEEAEFINQFFNDKKNITELLKQVNGISEIENHLERELEEWLAEYRADNYERELMILDERAMIGR